jgi:hypothetical protein
MGESGRGPSPRLWRKAHAALVDPVGDDMATMIFNDFDNINTVTATTAAAVIGPGHGYHAFFEDTGDLDDITQLGNTRDGVIRISAGDGADDDSVAIMTGGGRGSVGTISRAAAAARLTICEFRFRKTLVANDKGSVFLGLGEQPASAIARAGVADGIIGADDNLADDDSIGFLIDSVDGDALSFRYMKESGTETIVIASAQTLVANTFYKVGFIYDPSAPESQQIAIYIDNVEQSTYVTGTLMDVSADFPSGEFMNMCVINKGSVGTTPDDIELDWWSFYQSGKLS